MKSFVSAKEEEDSLLVRFRQDGEIVFKKLPWHNYFYVLLDDYMMIRDVIDSMITNPGDDSEIYHSSGRVFKRLYLRVNYMRNTLRNLIEEQGCDTFEADISSMKRVLIDHHEIALNQKGLHKLWVDIETDDREPLEYDRSGKIVPSHIILSVALRDFGDGGKVLFFRNLGIDDPDFDKYRELYRRFISEGRNPAIKIEIDKWDKIVKEALIVGEKELMKKTIYAMRERDLIMGWNYRGFDEIFLKGRAKKYGLSYDSMYTTSVDYMEMYKKNSYKSLKSYALEKVAQHEFRNEKVADQFEAAVEIGKIDWKKRTGLKKIFELFVLEPAILEEYNDQDVNLLELIEKKNNLLALHNVICDIAHCPMAATVFNSYVGDYMFLGDYKKIGYISSSTPNDAEKAKRSDPITGKRPGGGYTFDYLKGLFDDIEGFDIKSSYPLNLFTYNKSFETYIGNLEPDLESVFSPVEIEYIRYCESVAKSYIDKKGKLKEKDYLEDIDNKRVELSVSKMHDLMWRFIDKYDNSKSGVYAKEHDLVISPADINLDTRGWKVHPHRIFIRKMGVMPQKAIKLISERDKVKYSLKQFKEDSAEYNEGKLYEVGLKIVANSTLYGMLAFANSRFYNYDIADSITTCGRYALKNAIMVVKKSGFTITSGDTDSIFVIVKDKNDINRINKLLYDRFNEMVRPFNTFCEVEHKNPGTGEIEKLSHFIRMEHDKSMDAMIVVKKKRYYYKKGEEIKSTGGAMLRGETLALVVSLQKSLVSDYLNKCFDKTSWKTRLSELREKVFGNKLEEKFLVKTVGLGKKVEEYGRPLIDGSTGEQKIRKDGGACFAPIPANVQIAKRMMAEGQLVEVGDKIDFIISKSKPRIVPITVEDYRKGAEYDKDYYWERIITPLIEIIEVMEPEDCYIGWNEIWGFKAPKAKREHLKLQIEMQDDGGCPKCPI